MMSEPEGFLLKAGEDVCMNPVASKTVWEDNETQEKKCLFKPGSESLQHVEGIGT